MKKIILGTSTVLLLTAGGGYFYCAQQFGDNAQILVSAIEKAKPTVRFDSIEIDKYRFQIIFHNFTMDTKNAATVLGSPQEEPMSMSTPYNMVLFYNPFTKIAHITVPEKQFPIHLVQGKMDKQMNYSADGPIELKMAFKTHPVLKDFDLKKFIPIIKEFSAHRPKTAMVDAKTGQSLVSLDSARIDLKTNFPENVQEDAELNLNYHINNLFVDKDLFRTLKQGVEAALPEAKSKEIVRSIFNTIKNWTRHSTEKGEAHLKIKMETLNQLMGGNYDASKGIPSISGSLSAEGASDLGPVKVSFDMNFDPKLIKMKMDYSGKYTDEARSIISSEMMDMLKELYTNPKLAITEAVMPNLSAKTLLDITPDLASLGNISMSMNIDANLEKTEGKFDFALATAPYGFTAKGNYGMATGGKIEAEFTNYDQFMTDLKAYIDRAFFHEEIKSALPADAQEKTMQSLMMGQMTLETMGKKEQKDGKTVLKVEQIIPGLGQLPVMPGAPAAEPAVPTVPPAVPLPAAEPAK